MIRRGLGSYDDGETLSGDSRRSKTPVEVFLFVHRVLKASLLCSEHGRNEYQNRELVGGKIIPWSLITWPDDKQLQKFRSFEILDRPKPEAFTFAVPEWFAYEKGLI